MLIVSQEDVGRECSIALQWHSGLEKESSEEPRWTHPQFFSLVVVKVSSVSKDWRVAQFSQLHGLAGVIDVRVGYDNQLHIFEAEVVLAKDLLKLRVTAWNACIYQDGPTALADDEGIEHFEGEDGNADDLDLFFHTPHNDQSRKG